MPRADRDISCFRHHKLNTYPGLANSDYQGHDTTWLMSFKILTTRYRRTWNDLELTIRCVFRLLHYRLPATPNR